MPRGPNVPSYGARGARPLFAAEKKQQEERQLRQKVSSLTWENNVLKSRTKQLELQMQIAELQAEMVRQQQLQMAGRQHQVSGTPP